MDINKYLNLKLTEKPEKKETYKEDIIKVLDKANKELEKFYAGKYKFSLSTDDDDIEPDKLKLSPKRKRKIKEIWLKFDSELSEIQRNYEKNLQKKLENKIGLQDEDK